MVVSGAFVILMAGLASGSMLGKRGAETGTTPDAVPTKMESFAWLGGRWLGTAGDATTEELCSAPAHGEMMCMFRAMNAEKNLALEFITLRETPNGIEERVRFFSPELVEEAGDEGITLRLASYGEREIVFDNAKAGGVVKHVTILRVDKDEFATRIEVVNAEGKSGFIEAKWRRGN